MSAAGAGLEIAGALLGGILDQRALNAQAANAEENARLATLAGEQQVAQTYREERQVSGAALVALAGSGVALGTGTAADIIFENAVEREVEVLNVRARAASQSRDYRQAAEDARAAGKGALVRGVLAAGGAAYGYGKDRDTQARLDAQRKAEVKSRRPRPAGASGSGNIVSAERERIRRSRYGNAPTRFGTL